jgi:AraC-like DNA-binding protein
MLLERLRPRAHDARLRAIMSAIERSRGMVTMEQIASDSGVSVRHLERLLRPVLGVPPKRFARVVRFHHALSALLAGDRDAAL